MSLIPPHLLSSAPLPIRNTNSHKLNRENPLLTNLLSVALSLTLSSPLPSFVLPPLNSPSQSLSPTTPFSQSKNLPFGLENRKIRACPSINPSCVSTNPKSSNFKFPWQIPSNSIDNAVQKLKEVILSTLKNAKIQVVEDTPNGQYLRAEVDGGFGRDVLELLVKRDVVTYRCMATKVTYVYPFTTAFEDSTGQHKRIKKIVDNLGWYAHNFDTMDD